MDAVRDPPRVEFEDSRLHSRTEHALELVVTEAQDLGAKRYGINLRGSGQTITVKFNPKLRSEGKSRQLTPTIIEFGPAALRSEVELANTIAHELNHARSWLRGGNAPEETAYPAGNALAAFIEGLL